MARPEGSDARPSPFGQAYPHVARPVMTQGWIEIGQDDCSRSFIRALDVGGLVGEGDSSYPSVDEALQDWETGLAEWIRQQGIHEPGSRAKVVRECSGQHPRDGCSGP